MPDLWIVNCEMSVEPGDLKSGDTLAFTNVVTWGESSEDAIERVRTCSAKYKWIVLGVQKASLVDPDTHYGKDLNDLIDQALGNPSAILYGTFYSYKVN
jgi:hypothetical protein